LSIWIVLALLSVLMAPKIGSLFTHSHTRSLFGLTMTIGVPVYHAIALARLSRWPVLLLSVLIVVSALVTAMSIFRANFPWMTVAVMFAPTTAGLAVYLACILPHWRKMNWTLLGRPYRPAEDQVEVFA
jgi:hypothetical protein